MCSAGRAHGELALEPRILLRRAAVDRDAQGSPRPILERCELKTQLAVESVLYCTTIKHFRSAGLVPIRSCRRHLKFGHSLDGDSFAQVVKRGSPSYVKCKSSQLLTADSAAPGLVVLRTLPPLLTRCSPPSRTPCPRPMCGTWFEKAALRARSCRNHCPRACRCHHTHGAQGLDVASPVPGAGLTGYHR